MKKSHMFTLIFITIISIFIIPGFTFASDDDWVTDTSSGDTYVTSGNVGIGTSSPDSNLDVESTTGNGIIKIQGTGSGYTNAELLLKANAGTDYRGLGMFMLQDTSDKEWFIGQPYADADSIIISRRTGATSHSGKTAQNSNAFFKITSTGNVGIGTTSPDSNLDVESTTGNGIIKIQGAGNGYTNADLLLQANHASTDYRGLGMFMLQDTSDKEWFIGQPYADADSIIISRRTDATSHSGKTAQNSNAFFKITSAGNVGVGITSPQSKLAVNGKITAEEVEVTQNIAANEFTVRNSSWSDFVFEDNYTLPSLNQVESYIKENKHLPDIPSAKEVEEEGLSMAEMMKKQMQKIEELTLYVIELKKENENQSKEIAALRNELTKKNN